MAGFYGRSYELGGGHLWGYDEDRLNSLIWDAGFAVTAMRVEDTPLVPYIYLKAMKTHGVTQLAVETMKTSTPCIGKRGR